MFKNKYGEHDAELVRIAKAHATSLVGNHGFTIDDADDILQTLIIAGIEALSQFDSSKARRSTYLYSSIRHKAISLARYAKGKMRSKCMEKFSLDSDWPGDSTGETQWNDAVGLEHTLTENGTPQGNRADILGLRIDVEKALEDLPPKLRELCRFHSQLDVEDARRAAGMSKSSHHRAIKRLRVFLEIRGLKPNSPKISGTF